MEKILRIGQVSNLYGISLDTLRYYDRKGLLKPMVDQQNGYRYYAVEQLDTLEMILVGKHLEIPLEQIKEKMDSERIEGYLEMVRGQIEVIEAKQAELAKLIQYTTSMMNKLNHIENHKNDNSFSTVDIEKNMDVSIFQVNLKDILNTRSAPMINGIEAFEQWVLYDVNEEGAMIENTQAIGLSIHREMVHANELYQYLDAATEQGGVSKYELSGAYRHISFWGKESDLREYLRQLGDHFKLRDTTLHIQFGFALLHKDLNHEYWVDIYFPDDTEGS